MSDLRWCKDCRKHHWREETCDPAWECIGDWEDLGIDDDNWHKVRAWDSQAAAQRYAERYDCEGGDYYIIGHRGHDEPIIYVRKPVTADDLDDFIGPRFAERFQIRAEAVPTYYADRIGPAPAVDQGDII